MKEEGKYETIWLKVITVESCIICEFIEFLPNGLVECLNCDEIKYCLNDPPKETWVNSSGIVTVLLNSIRNIKLYKYTYIPKEE